MRVVRVVITPVSQAEGLTYRPTQVWKPRRSQADSLVLYGGTRASLLCRKVPRNFPIARSRKWKNGSTQAPRTIKILIWSSLPNCHWWQAFSCCCLHPATMIRKNNFIRIIVHLAIRQVLYPMSRGCSRFFLTSAIHVITVPWHRAALWWAITRRTEHL